ncbi:glyoxalase superfamily protein [Acetobacter fallax]|uniref:Glyoxalase-related protein domain-containing protein n=2 Tax=Acetobacter fallax TaxID=1737473 RepID=A0ABX0KGV3_9PROT|nr:glyoxalase superfamily protein [Acetobacter fallax]NHO34376.1 hypothetical protein [Acetobacter fallax]
MARILRETLAGQHLVISHSASLELVAKQLGYSDWNVLSARLGGRTSRAEPVLYEPEAANRLPEGWSASGRLELFRYDLLPGAGPQNIPAIVIESRASSGSAEIAKPGDFLTVMQRISAVRYRGQSVSFRAQVNCADATGSGRIWISARGYNQKPLTFENLGLEGEDPAGPITGTTAWTQRSVTIEIPDAAIHLSFGVLFGSGTGTFRAADLSFGLAVCRVGHFEDHGGEADPAYAV